MGSRDGDTTRVSVRPVCAPVDPHAEACLVTIYGPDLGRKISLERDVMTIGRDPRNDVVVPLDEISRQHCRIEKSADAVLVRDLESTNGTHLNDRALLASVDYELASGDLIHLGGVVFKFLDGGDVESLYHEEIYRMTIVDGLTRVYNRRYLLDFLGRDMSRCRRHRRPLTILLFDVDHFKRINDEHGQMAGDHVLREICALVSSGVRREECLARYGGDEFVIVMPETRLDAARLVGERLRGLVEARDFRLGSSPLQVTVSIGLAELMPHMSEPSQFLQAADANLYAAKNAGRNALAG